jgi:hypothetical protein
MRRSEPAPPLRSARPTARRARSTPARAAALVALALALGAWPGAAAAFPIDIPGLDEPLRIDIVNSLFFDSHWDNEDGDPTNDDYFDIRNRLNLDLSLGDYTLGGRFDATYFPDPPADAYRDDYRMETFYFRVQKETVSIILGDYYAAFGRGIALYFRKVDELSFDPSLRGAYVDWFSGPLHLTLLGGLVNDINVDDRAEKKLDDPNDLVLGARFEGTIADYVTLGAHGVMYLNRKDFPPSGDFAPQDRIVLGATVELPDIADVVSFYAEFDTLSATDVRYGAEGGLPTYTSEEDRAWAAYAATTASFLGFTLLGEFRYYEDWLLTPTLRGESVSKELRYARPPTLERVRERFIDNLDGSFGLRARIDYTLPTHTIPYVNVLHLWDEPREGGRTLHVYAGVVQRLDSIGFLADVSGGYRWSQEERIGGGGLQDHTRMWHVELMAETIVWKTHSVALDFHHEEYTQVILGRDKDFHIGEFVASYSFAPWVDASFLWGYSTELDSRKDNYFGGDVRVRFTSDSFVRIFVGAKKGGLICVNGVCRNEPPFEGVRAEVVVRF